MTPDTLITSRSEFQQALRNALAALQDSACRELWFCDEDFSNWPLGEKETIEQLSGWAHAHRRLVVLARGFDEVARRHPRWVRWRRDWSHIVSCRSNVELAAGEFPTVLLGAGTVSVRISDPQRFRGRLSHSNVELVKSKELLDAILQRSEETFPATTTGL